MKEVYDRFLSCITLDFDEDRNSGGIYIDNGCFIVYLKRCGIYSLLVLKNTQNSSFQNTRLVKGKTVIRTLSKPSTILREDIYIQWEKKVTYTIINSN